MTPTPSRFALLLDLAKEPASDRRRDLLREVTDLFFETEADRSDREHALFDEVLRAVATNVEEDVLGELAHRFADHAGAPRGLIADLASADNIAVSRPVLQRSPLLSDEDLVRLVSSLSQDHIQAVARRAKVSETVSSAIVEKGDDAAVTVLMQNEGARLSRDAFERVVDRAQTSAALHEGVVARSDLPLDLLNEMYFVVEQRLRAKILARNDAVPAEELDAALQKARARVRETLSVAVGDVRAAREFIQAKKAAGQLTGSLLVSLYRDHKMAEFLQGLAELTGVDLDTAHGVLQRKDLDALATICRASGMERPLFVTLAVLACGEGDSRLARAEEYGRLYASVPVEAAQRAMRFFRVRKGTAGSAPNR